MSDPKKDKQPVILIIDDDEAVCRVLQHLLVKAHFTPLIANNGEEGLTLARSGKPDLIFLDIFMPGEDGFSILARLKQEPELASVPVLIFSIIEGETHQKKAKEFGAAGYIAKPFDMRKIVPQIESLLQNL